MGASLSTALGDRVHARRDVLDILRVDARHREAAVARAEDVMLRRERVHLLRVRLQLCIRSLLKTSGAFLLTESHDACDNVLQRRYTSVVMPVSVS